jgi:hypothetical protein
VIVIVCSDMVKLTEETLIHHEEESYHTLIMIELALAKSSIDVMH